MLLTVSAFELQDDDTFVLTGDLNDFMDEVYVRELVNNGLLSPIFEPPVPWTQINKGGIPSDHWARGISLISGHHRQAEAAVRDAIGKRKMQRVLAALNYLQSPAFAINKPLLAFMRRVRRPVVEKPMRRNILETFRQRTVEEMGKSKTLRRQILLPPKLWSIRTASGLHNVSTSAAALIQSRISTSPGRITSAHCFYSLTVSQSVKRA
jgi:hypothetical protein